MNDYSILYQSILGKLSTLPVGVLHQLDDFLTELQSTTQVEKETNNYQKTMALAGSWNDMSEGDFQEYLTIIENKEQIESENTIL